jgi:branched-chain amino acid transport system substrate-binding protein
VLHSLRIAAAVALCALLFAVPRAGQSADPIEIYSITATTGGLAFIGRAANDALAAYEEAFNKSGGINGRPIHFVIQDSQTNPQVALQLFNDIQAKHPAFVIGPESAAECNAVFAVAKTGPLVWCYSSAVTATPGSFEFQTSATNFDHNAAAIHWLRKRGLTRIALITPTDATGQTYDRSIDELLAKPENKGLTLVDREHFAPADTSVSAQISKIAAANPQVLIVGTAGSPAGTVFHGLADVGLNVPVITGNGNASQAFMKQYAAILPKELYVESTHCLAPAAIVDRSEKEAYDAYTAAMAAKGIPLDCLQSLAWDPALILTIALRHVGPSATPDALRAYISGIKDLAGVNGTYDFQRVPQRGIDDRAVVIIRWNEARGTWIPASKVGGDPL